MIEAETETAEIPIKKTAQVVLPMGSTSLESNISPAGANVFIRRLSDQTR
jgi:hypothetical protein